MKKLILHLCLSVLGLLVLSSPVSAVAETAALGDLVWIDFDNNGIQDIGEPGFRGARVNLLDAGGLVVDTTVTNSSGRYSFTGLAPGTYSLEFVRPGGYTFTLPDQGSDTSDSDAQTTEKVATSRTIQTFLDAGEVDLTWDAGLNPCPASLGDLVWNDLNRNGIQEAGEPGVSGVTVHLLDAYGTVVGTTVTDGNGIYGFTDLDPGTYSVQFILPAGYAFTGANQGDDTLDSDADPLTGKTGPKLLSSGREDLTRDAGLYQLVSPGVGSPGYWKNHPEEWPVDMIVVGGVIYTKAQALEMLSMSVKGDKTYTMFKAVLAAKLNIADGNSGASIAGTLAAADAWLVAHPVGSGVTLSSSAWREAEGWYIILDAYNNGFGGIPHR